MEAQLVSALPKDGAWQFEPKWDGFRCLAFRKAEHVELRAKSGKPLGRYFPEIVSALSTLRARRFVLDGELLIRWAARSHSMRCKCGCVPRDCAARSRGNPRHGVDAAARTMSAGAELDSKITCIAPDLVRRANGVAEILRRGKKTLVTAES
jgi:hypothetical protein